MNPSSKVSFDHSGTGTAKGRRFELKHENISQPNFFRNKIAHLPPKGSAQMAVYAKLTLFLRIKKWAFCRTFSAFIKCALCPAPRFYESLNRRFVADRKFCHRLHERVRRRQAQSRTEQETISVETRRHRSSQSWPASSTFCKSTNTRWANVNTQR